MFLDTSGLFALHYDKDPRHAKAALHYDAETTPRLTHAGILEELIALAHARKVHRHTTLSFVEDILGDADIEIVWADPPLHRRALDLLHARPDKSYSLCDAVSFRVWNS